MDGTCWAVIPAGGQGLRLGAGRPKQFVPLAGHPLLAWSVKAVDESFRPDGIVVVAADGFLDETESLVRSLDLRTGNLLFVPGGSRRQDSVRLGLTVLPPGCDRVAVHDGARPFIGTSLADRLTEAVTFGRGSPGRGVGAAVPGLPAVNTVKRVRDGVVLETLDRSELYDIQTPQVFDRGLLEKAHSHALRTGEHASDDAALVERLGVDVRVLPGEWFNLKVTTKRDIFLLDCMIRSYALVPGLVPP